MRLPQTVFVVKYDIHSNGGECIEGETLAVCSTKERAKTIICTIIENVEEALDDRGVRYSEESMTDDSFVKIESENGYTFRYYYSKYKMDKLDGEWV